MIALIRLSDKAVVQVFDNPPGRLELPDDAGQVSPAEIGWEGGGELYIDGDGNWQTGPARFALVDIKEAVVPETKEVVDSTYIYDKKTDMVVETAQTIDKPIFVEPSDVEKLESATGLTVAQIKKVLGL